MPNQACPSPAELADYAGGFLGDENVAAISDHLLRCGECKMRIDELGSKTNDKGTDASARLDDSWDDHPIPPYVAPQKGLLPEETSSIDPHATRPLTQRTRFPIFLRCPDCSATVAATTLPEDGAVVCSECRSAFNVDFEQTASWSAGSRPALGKFELLEVVGKGAFGTVYRARDTELDRIVAVKVPRSGAFSTDEDEARFVGEARKVAHLSHRGIVPVHEVGRGDDFPYIVTEFVEGLTLADARTARKFTEREAAELVAEIADALEHAHSKGVIHRDLKPANIMLERNEASSSVTAGSSTGSGSSRPASSRGNSLEYRPRLMDFGLARRDGDRVTVTIEGQVMGTPAYMSPEQARGEAHIADGRTDVYSLGVILYELLAGERPFRGNIRALMEQVQHQDAPSVRLLNSTISLDLDTICLKCLEKKPEQRYQTARELRDELHRFLRSEPIHARPISALNRTWRWCMRRRTMTLTVATSAAIVLLAIVVAFVLISRSRDKAIELAGQREAARKEAVASKDQAVHFFRKTQQTVDKSFTGFSEALKFYPGMQSVRRSVLEAAARDYEELSQMQLGDLGLEIERGRAYLRLGDIYRQLDDPPRARAKYERAGAHFASLRQQYPDALTCRLEQGNSQTRIAQLLRIGGDYDAAEDVYTAAIDFFDQLLQQLEQDRPDEDSSPYLDAFGTTLVNLSVLLMETDRGGETEEHLDRAIAAFEQLCATDPEELRYEEALATAHSVRGSVRHELGDYDNAVEELSASLRSFNKLVAAEPDNPSYLDARAETTIYLALSLRIKGRYGDEQAAYESAIEDYTRLIRTLPDLPQFHEKLALTQLDLGQLLHELGHNPRAKDQLEAALEVLDQLVVADPARVFYHELHAGCQDALGQTLRELGEHEQALQLHLAAVSGFTQIRNQQQTSVDLPRYRERLAVAIRHLAQVYHQIPDRDKAMEGFESAASELDDLAKHYADPSYENEAAFVYADFAAFLHDVDEPEKARIAADKATRIWSRLVADNPQPDFLFNLARFLVECPVESERATPIAIAHLTRAIDEAEQNPEYQTMLGLAYYRADDLDAAAEAVHRAVALRQESTDADALVMAMIKTRLRDSEEAQVHLQRGLDWMQRNRPASLRIQRLADEARGILEQEGTQ